MNFSAFFPSDFNEQYDWRRPASHASHNGSILEYNPICPGLQYFEQDHRTNTESLRHSTLFQAERLRSLKATSRDMRNRKGSPSLQVYASRLYYFQVQHNEEGLTALIFTSEGDMRQAINNLQSTWSGFGFVSGTNVFKVCDQPHPVAIQAIIRSCQKGDIETALKSLTELWDQGYSAIDIVTTIFRVVKSFNEYVRKIHKYRCITHSAVSGCPNTPNLSLSK